MSSGPLGSESKISLGLLCLFEQKLRPLHFVVFQQGSCFSLPLSLSINIIPNATTSSRSLSLSLCAIVITDQTKTHTFLHFNLLEGGKKIQNKRPWKVVRDISSWLILFSQSQTPQSKWGHSSQPSNLCQLFLGSHKCGNCPVCQRCVTSSAGAVMSVE